MSETDTVYNVKQYILNLIHEINWNMVTNYVFINCQEN